MSFFLGQGINDRPTAYKDGALNLQPAEMTMAYNNRLLFGAKFVTS